MLVDSHCHLNFPDFQEDFDAILQNAKEAGVVCMQTICTKISEFHNILAIAEKYPQIYASVGIHPNEAATEPNLNASEIAKHCSHGKVIGIGETGLDFYYENSPREEQLESFIQHIIAAQQTQLPIIIHSRSADLETAELLEKHYQIQAFKGLLHCFTGSEDLAKRALDLGLYISISGIITFKKADELRAIVKNIPLDRLLVETDAPYLAPTPHRGKRNEPAFVKHTAIFLAELYNLSIEEFSRITTENFYRLFSKAKKPY